MKSVDCRGFACPKPVIMTKKELDSMESGEIEVIVDNETARENVLKYAKNEGYIYDIRESEGLYYVKIRKEAANSRISESKEDKSLVIMVSSNVLGSGDEKLGSALMKSYMYALTEADNKITTMLFLNSGVKLTTEGSDVLESLKSLEQRGVEILSCGTCLDFYNLKEKLQVGSVTNMYTIVSKMNCADNTIKL